MIKFKLLNILQESLPIIKIKNVNNNYINSNKPIYNKYKFYLLTFIKILTIYIYIG